MQKPRKLTPMFDDPHIPDPESSMEFTGSAMALARARPLVHRSGWVVATHDAEDKGTTRLCQRGPRKLNQRRGLQVDYRRLPSQVRRLLCVIPVNGKTAGLAGIGANV